LKKLSKRVKYIYLCLLDLGVKQKKLGIFANTLYHPLNLIGTLKYAHNKSTLSVGKKKRKEQIKKRCAKRPTTSSWRLYSCIYNNAKKTKLSIT
jgi:hypothetical protein